MEAGRARNRDDNPGLPTLSLGLSSVRHIVTKLETEYARVVTNSAFKSEIVKYTPEQHNDYYDYPFDPEGYMLNRFVVNLRVAFSRCIPSVTIANFGFLAVTAGLFAPRMISYLVVYPFCRLVFGTLYPAYASYKAVRTKNLKEYVKWMMYWIVFALFTCTETFTDVFLSWFPFYYEVKIVLVLWLLSPATKGSSILYRKFVHPALCRREQEIDEYIAKAKDQGYHTVLNLGTKGVNYATTVIMQTAIKGGGGLVQQLRKSYSLSDLSECEPHDERRDEADDVLAEPRIVRRAVKSGYTTRRSASESNSRTPIYFPEVDVDVRPARNRMDEPDFSHIKSTDDISSGYSSAENSSSLTRTSSVGAALRRARTPRSAVTAIKRPPAAEDNQVIIEEPQDDDSLDYTNPSVNYSPLFLSHTNPPFIYQYIGDQVKIIQILGNYPMSDNSAEQNYDLNYKRDQDEDNYEILTSVSDNEEVNKATEQKNINKDLDIPDDIKSKDNNNIIAHDCKIVELIDDIQNSNKLEKTSVQDINSSSVSTDNLSDTLMDDTFYDSSQNESDDEALFITPVSTPIVGRKMKGKYGKDKAPLPPTIDLSKSEESLSSDKPNFYIDCNLENDIPMNVLDMIDSNNEIINVTEISKNIRDVEDINIMDKHIEVTNNSMDVKPEQDLTVGKSNDDVTVTTDFNLELNQNTYSLYDKQRYRKSISPPKNSKGSTTLGKLLQFPGKLAFWHKTDDKSVTNSSDTSRRSSADNVIDEFQTCSNLNVSKNDIPKIEITDASKNKDDDNMTNEIKTKSDDLQRIIDAKLENHPEYKIVSLHEELPTTSKSTEV